MKKREVRYCVYCGKEVIRDRYRMPKERTYCSRACAAKTKHPEDRFWNFVDKSSSPNGCWEWTGRTMGSGYGSFTTNSPKHVAAHRYSWELRNGPIPEGMCILHSCDNRRCVNPDHLRLGTPIDNIKDAVDRNRFPTGDNHWTRRTPGWKPKTGGQGSHRRTILSAEDVRNIRSLYAGNKISIRALGKKYGVSQRAIHDVIVRHTWSHIE